MTRLTCSINAKVREKKWNLRDSLSFVNDQAIPVGIAERRPMANLRFSRPEEEGNFMVAQVFESGLEIVDFKCN
jgi:hypothetical protein